MDGPLGFVQMLRHQKNDKLLYCCNFEGFRPLCFVEVGCQKNFIKKSNNNQKENLPKYLTK